MTTTTVTLTTPLQVYFVAPRFRHTRRKKCWRGYRSFMNSLKEMDSEFTKPGPFNDGVRGGKYLTRRFMQSLRG